MTPDKEVAYKAVVDDNIYFVLKDERLCRSNNMQKFFKKERNKIYNRVIRFEGKLWFATMWDEDEGDFSGVKVVEVACYGNKAETRYPSWQSPDKWHDVTDWFWSKYRERGMVSIPEIWHLHDKKSPTSKEAHSI